MEEHQTGAHSQQQSISGPLDSISSQTLNVFGYDYTRNPMLFLSSGIFALSNTVCSLIILITSLLVACKLRGRQESMSDKSQVEHQKLTNVLMLDAYVPVFLSLLPAINLAICLIRHECL